MIVKYNRIPVHQISQQTELTATCAHDTDCVRRFNVKTLIDSGNFGEAIKLFCEDPANSLVAKKNCPPPYTSPIPAPVDEEKND
jgi:hypothetical protein